ncbi:hypothetical protein NKR23_g787 [Pleurostoma richardsiae]|uniref:Glutaredoxin-like protein n=1 Tax=Pleurostoma richardsiae TaxID=41990 RepID=A0AA38RU60_9PEZI|nr:hypothetical protein NKR23_g787 [Pleurostoma richardsiae]
MRVSSRLLQSCRITLFTRHHCGLCVKARDVLGQVQKTRPFVYKEIDIIQPSAQGWRDLYDMDVPVIHISKADSPEEDPKLSSKALKLMHRFTPEEVEAKMDAAEKA